MGMLFLCVVGCRDGSVGVNINSVPQFATASASALLLALLILISGERHLKGSRADGLLFFLPELLDFN